MCELFAVFAVDKERKREAFEFATVQAYQTVRIWVMSHKKDGLLKLPSINAVLGKDASVATSEMSPTKARAFLEVLAAKTGGKVRRVKPSRRKS